MADNHHKNHPIHKVTISGPTLSSLLNHLTSSTSPTTGLLYGDFSLLSPSPLSDDSPSPSSPPPPSLIATISGFSPIVSPALPHRRAAVIGWFSARRRSPLRPSLLDHSLSLTHSSTTTTPFIFLLLTTTAATSTTQTLIHTHEYRAYQFNPNSVSFETVSLEVVNIGPGFRGQYGHFSPKSGLPWTACVSHVGSPMREDASGSKSLSELKRVGVDQKDLDVYVSGGYDVASLTRLVGSDAVGYMSGVEDLYEKMLAKLHGLTRVVETSSARLLELECHNMKLRRRVAGIE
ncbi:hypothetical protein RND81_13G067400 [Saponaria officinalis]|uniref:Uncharacterized protein n=1 Tax=Saponaria officinalis TaxID=3572 RepID=A0AAW1GXM3_SAPOF